MKIGGPKPPPPRPEGAESSQADKSTASQKSGSSDFARALEGTAGTEQATTTQAASSPAMAELLAKLKSGAIDGPGAAKAMVEHVVKTRAASLAPELRAKLREVLEQALAEDPMLAAKVQNLRPTAGSAPAVPSSPGEREP